jgi:hypothetical protein
MSVVFACRIEYFKPHYILGPRPSWEFVPTVVEYGTTFRVLLAANTTASSIDSVVLVDAGTTTHSSNMATRNQKLEFTVASAHELIVTAPANNFMAPPSKLRTALIAFGWNHYAATDCACCHGCLRLAVKFERE